MAKNIFKRFSDELAAATKNLQPAPEHAAKDVPPPPPHQKKKQKIASRKSPIGPCHTESGQSSIFKAGFLSTEMVMRDRIHFELTPEEVETIKEADDADVELSLLELTARAIIVAQRLAGRPSTAAERKRLQEQLTQSETSLSEALVSNTVLKARVEEYEGLWRQMAIDNEVLSCKNAQLKKDIADLELHLKSIQENHKREILELKGLIVEEHKRGFEKAVRQAVFLSKKGTFLSKDLFDVNADIYKGKWTSLHDIPDDLSDA